MYRYSWIFIMLQMGDKSWTDFDYGKGETSKESKDSEDIVWVKTPEDVARLRAQGKI